MTLLCDQFGDSRLPDHFWENVQPELNSGCWLWTGHADAFGYGKTRRFERFGFNRVHRITYSYLVGPIPDGLVCDHLCRVRLCCNPAHIEPVTNRENIRRGLNGNRKACKHGHQYEPDNFYLGGDGHRRCRQCLKNRNARFIVRRRESRAPMRVGASL